MTPSRASIEHRVRAVRVGVQATTVVLAAMALYRMSPSGQAIPLVPFLSLWSITAGGALIAALLPWDRVLSWRRGLWVLYVWSAADIVLIATLLGITDPGDSTLFLLYTFTTVFFAASYPIGAQVWLFVLTIVSYIIVVQASTAAIPAERLWFRIAALGVIAFVSSFMSRELLRRTAEYESLIRAQSDLGQGVCVVDLATTRFLYVNDAFCRILGYTREQLLDLGSFLELTLSDDREVFEDRIDRRGRGGEIPDNEEVTVRRKDGSHVHVEAAYKPVDDSHVIVLIRDVTERKAAEDEIRNSISLLEATLESTADGILVVDAHGRIVVFNEKFVDLWRIPPDLLETRDDETLLGYVLGQLKQPEVFLAKIRELYGSDSESFDVVEFNDGRVFERWSQPQRIGGRDGRTVGRVWSFRDVTERVEAERALLTMNRALLKSDHERQQLLAHLVRAKEEERRRVAADIHDDSVQVMTSVALGLERLGRKVDDLEVRGLITRLEGAARDAVARLRTMVFELRPPSLDEDGLATALRLYLEEFRSDTGIEAELVVRLEDEPTTTTRTVLYRVAQEALTNVRKHSRAARVTVVIAPDDGGVRMRIEDDGVGFAGSPERPQLARHIGLIEMRERAEIVGGRCEVRSTLGGGTAVEIWVPDEPAMTSIQASLG